MYSIYFASSKLLEIYRVLLLLICALIELMPAKKKAPEAKASHAGIVVRVNQSAAVAAPTAVLTN